MSVQLQGDVLSTTFVHFLHLIKTLEDKLSTQESIAYFKKQISLEVFSKIISHRQTCQCNLVQILKQSYCCCTVFVTAKKNYFKFNLFQGINTVFFHMVVFLQNCLCQNYKLFVYSACTQPNASLSQYFFYYVLIWGNQRVRINSSMN